MLFFHWSEREQHYFYPLCLFLIAGKWSFLTGDIFNLFVCFEVMLVASYVLISSGHQMQLIGQSNMF